MRNKNIYISGTFFFLKNLWFAPSVNFYYILFGIVLLILKGGQDLKHHDILLSMFLLCFSSYGMGRTICDKSGMILSCFRMLPIRTEHLIRLFALSALLYSATIQTVLTAVLGLSLGLPFIGNAHITFTQSQDGEIMSIASGYITDLSGRIEIPYHKILEPSLFFGIVKTPAGYPVFPFWWLILPVLCASLTFYFISSHHIAPVLQRNNHPVVWNFILLSIIALLITGLIVDSFSDSKMVWALRSLLDIHLWIIPALFGSLSLLVILLLLYYYRPIFRGAEVIK
ncbi:MAG: hypothetical protein JW915_24825 [Chitinispirillaceae bacterium]|nr:hypothetical protein [Chitinispirillaceae bacterium]